MKNVLFAAVATRRSESCVWLHLGGAFSRSIQPIQPVQPVQPWKIVEFYKNWFALQCLLVVQKISTRSSDYLVGLLVRNSRLLLFLGERYMDFLYLERFFVDILSFII